MLNALRKALRSFKKDQSGVTAIEYGLIALVMAAFVIWAFKDNIVPAMEKKVTTLHSTINEINVGTAKATDDAHTLKPKS